MIRQLIFLTFGICAISCGQRSSKIDLETAADQSSVPISPTEVEIVTLSNLPFHQELIANGKLAAINRADLKFNTSGIIEQILVEEGHHVRANQLMAVLNDEVQLQTQQQATLRYRKASLEYEDQLLRMGYRIADTAAIDHNVKQMARLRSGLSEAEIEMNKADKDISRTQLYAPFAGKVANLTVRPHQPTSGAESVCTLIDDRELFVEFAVLEQELDFVRASKTVVVKPFSDGNSTYRGQIRNINPQVDKGGMIVVKGVIRNQDGGLIDGMSVSVVVSRDFGDQLIVPKEAVLDRQGRKVVFTATESGTAYWNYVETSYENSTHYAIKEGLKPGDRVIYVGNFNLAHDKPIVVQHDNQ